MFETIFETIDELKDYLIHFDCNDTIFFENPDFVSAIVGISDDDRLIYDYDKMVDFLMKTKTYDLENLTDAIDYIDHNVMRELPYMGEKKPIILITPEN